MSTSKDSAQPFQSGLRAAFLFRSHVGPLDFRVGNLSRHRHGPAAHFAIGDQRLPSLGFVQRHAEGLTAEGAGDIRLRHEAAWRFS